MPRRGLISSFVAPFPQRGKWGDNKYPGNVSGHLVKAFVETFGPQTALDPMCGSCTACEVFDELNIKRLHYDLSRGDDILSLTTRILIRRHVAEISDNSGIDLIFWHPPYWNMVKYHPIDRRDFSSVPYPTYLNYMHRALEFLSSLLNTVNSNTRIGVLLGDLRYGNGRYYWIVRDVFTPAALTNSSLEIDTVVIRGQYNVTSRTRLYDTPQPLIRIMHEYLMILKPTDKHLEFQRQ